MGQQIINGGFRVSNPDANGFQWNLIDNSNTSSKWTGGATIIDPVPIQAPLGGVFAIVGWTISFNGSFNYVAPGPYYGRPGRLVSVITRANPTPGGNAGAWVTPALPLPASDLGPLWDGDTDPPFPVYVAPPTPVPGIAVTNILANPVQIETGEAVSIGLWLTPSLTRNLQIGIFNATYALIYDDGQPRQAGWGG